MDVTVTVNGRQYTRPVDERRLLVHFLREDLGLTGAHVGCVVGRCGACTVVWNGRAVKSCMVLAVQADGGEVTTIEGLERDGALHPVQRSFWECDAVECGYCTPGMIMSAYALLEADPNAGEDEVKEALSGNICRCTGYLNILKAVGRARESMTGAEGGS